MYINLYNPKTTKVTLKVSSKLGTELYRGYFSSITGAKIAASMLESKELVYTWTIEATNIELNWKRP